MTPDDGDHGDLLERIQSRYELLRKSERRVADYLRDMTGQRLDATITELAHQLDVSEATISRLSRALGYRGFQDMKLSLAQSTRNPFGFENIPVDLNDKDDALETSQKLSNALTRAIQETQILLDKGRLERAIEYVRTADRVVFVGVGGAASVCDEAVHLFLKAGAQAVSLRDGYTQVISAALASERTTVVGISHTGTTRTVANTLRLAAQHGAKTIAITSDAGSEVGRAASITLETWCRSNNDIPLYGDFLEGRIAQLYLIDLIYLGYIFATGEPSRRSLEATARALREYYQPKED